MVFQQPQVVGKSCIFSPVTNFRSSQNINLNLDQAIIASAIVPTSCIVDKMLSGFYGNNSWLGSARKMGKNFDVAMAQ